jgi:predicted GNAT family acetyltransferase
VTEATNSGVSSGEFQIPVDGHLARLVYRIRAGRLILIHTEVPEELEGRGLGGQLVSMALDRAKAEGLVVVPECPFARSWLERHPDRAAGISIDWSAPS